jgi:glycosyltransferase involved in cell wall biosynthesis
MRKTVFVPIGSNIAPHGQNDIHEEVIERYNITRDKCVLVYFGMAYPGKGLDLLLGAASRLERVHGLNFQLLCVGGGVSDVNAYQIERHRRVAELGLENHITWTGRIPAPHVSSLLTVSDIVALPYESGASDRRGSLLAALAHGKPIVTTPPRVRIPHFSNGGNMIWPESTSPESLSRTIARLYEDRSLGKTLGKGALELASKLQWQEIAEDTILLFEKVRDAAAN